jgi:hypothetical protein
MMALPTSVVLSALERCKTSKFPVPCPVEVISDSTFLCPHRRFAKAMSESRSQEEIYGNAADDE